MRVGVRIKELCAALEGMDSATAAEIHQAAFPELDVNTVRTYCSRSVEVGGMVCVEVSECCKKATPKP